MIPDNIEKIIMTKEDYDRNVEKLLIDKCNAELEVERLNNIINELIRRLEDLIIVGEQVENGWAVDICKMIIKELKGSDKK